MNFERKYFIKDLTNLNSLVKDAFSVEFASFTDFFNIIIKDRRISLDNVNNVIIPVESAEEVDAIFKINPYSLPLTIIYLKDFSKETRSAFKESFGRRLLIDANKISDFVEELKNDPDENFINFLGKSIGYYRDTISYNDIDNIIYKFSDPYYKFPFFAISDINWNWESFNNCTMEDLKKINYHLNMVRYNLFKSHTNFNLQQFGGNFQLSCTWNFNAIPDNFSPKRIYIKNGNMYIDNDIDGAFSRVNLYNELNAEKVPIKELDTLRQPYDTKFSKNCGIFYRDLIRISQNYKICKNAAMIPYITSIINNFLMKGII